MSRVTIKDIAKLLKISPSTVSRALKGHPDISTATIEKVQKLAADLDYIPNYQAISFRKRQSKLIGLIIPDMNMFFFPYVIKSIEEMVRQQGYHLIVLHSNNSLQGEISNIKIAQHIGVEGLIVSVSEQTQNLQHFSEIAAQNTPIVLFDRVLNNEQFPTITIQDEKVAFKAVHYLIQQGYQHICGIFGNHNLNISRQRFYGFKKALVENGLPFREDFVIFADSLSEAKDGLSLLLHTPMPPDAVFCMSDEVLVGVLQAIQLNHLAIPKDMAIIAISNGVVPHFFNPPITHIEHSGLEVGRLTARTLFDLLGNFKVERNNFVTTSLKVLHST